MAVFRELTGNINFIDVTSLPTTDIKDQVIYRLAKGNQYLFYTYNKNVSKWIQIDKSVLVVTTTAEMLNDTTKTYYLSRVDGLNQVGYYVVLNNTPTRLVTTKDIEDIKSTVNTANQNASSALEKATTAETNATTALSTATNASSTASNANSVATTANTTANTAKEKADSADTKADTAISTANEALNKANAVASVYRPQPSVESLADLPKPSAITANNVYNIKSAFVTNADFIEGAGVPYPAGTNVAVVLDNYTYKYDSLAGFVDLSNYQEKLKSGVNIKTVNGQSILGSGDLQIESVVANPTLAGTEEKLTGLQVGETKYSVGDIGEITVEASQFASGTEVNLTEEQVTIIKSCSVLIITIPILNQTNVLIKDTELDNIAYLRGTAILGEETTKQFEVGVDYSSNFAHFTERTILNINPNVSATGGIPLNSVQIGNNIYSILEELPAITSADTGKVLTVVNGEPTWQAPASGLPTVTSADSGKFLTVNSSGQWVATTVPNAEESSF